MRKLAFLAPLATVLAVAAPAAADPASVNVTLGAELKEKSAELGEHDVRRQADRLAETVRRALSGPGELDGARIELVLTDVKPNRPTMEQMAQRPGLDGHRSLSIGGAAIEGSITTADGRVLPVRYDWYSNSIADVRGYATWQDAERTYDRFAARLADGRYLSR